MRQFLFCCAVALLSWTGAWAAAPGQGGEALGLIVRYGDAAGVASRSAVADEAASATRAAQVSAVLRPLGVTATLQRTLASGAQLLRFDRARSLAEAEALAMTVARLPGVRYAVPNRIVRPQAVPTDPEFGSQWGFQYVPGSVEGANFTAAWEVTRGAAGQTLGIIDAGISRLNEELAGQLRIDPLFPKGGYDFYSDAATSGDGDGRDDDPEQAPAACGHGTHVAGTMGARTTFSGVGVGVAGGSPDSRLLMARALNLIGTDADVIDAMYWMAGATVPGVAVNPNVPVVLNMSLGSYGGACGGGYQEAVDALAAAGVVTVAAAGNNSGDAALFTPANCRGVISVAATDVAADKGSFSNSGPAVTLAAPGVGILSTGGIGATNVSCYKDGTSMASPHVSAAVGLLRAVSPSLGVGGVALALKAGARGFPSGSTCAPGGVSVCGAGLLDARGALDAVTGSTVRVGWNDRNVVVRENAGSVTLTVTRIGDPTQAASASVTTINGTAQLGVDYGAPTSPTLNWAANDTAAKSVTLPIIHRSGMQPGRDFTLTLAATVPTGAQVAAPSALTVRIEDVDCVSAPIGFGQTLSGVLDAAHPENHCHGGARGEAVNTNRYRFEGQAGDVVSIDLASTTPGPAVLDPYLLLLDPDLNIIAQNDDIVAGVQRNSRLSNIVLTRSGTHYIEATTWSAGSDATGSYDLTLHCGGYVGGSSCNLDADGDGLLRASDALLILRRLLGVGPAKLTDGISWSSCATRTGGSAIANFIDAQSNPSNPPMALDIDGDGHALATTDGVVLLRTMLGLSGNAVTAGAIGASPSRAAWADIRAYLGDHCGFVLPP